MFESITYRTGETTYRLDGVTVIFNWRNSCVYYYLTGSLFTLYKELREERSKFNK